MSNTTPQTSTLKHQERSVMTSFRAPRRLAAATAFAFCLSLPATAMAIPQIGDLPRSDPSAQSSTKSGDTPSDYPGTSDAPVLVTAHTGTPRIQATTVDEFDWTDAIIGAGGATAVLVIVLGGGTLAARSRGRARPLA
jgi:hypothetical protein